MNEPMKNTRCQWGCWGLAALIGLVVFIVSLSMMHMHWPSALFIAALVFILLGLLLSWAFCGASQTESHHSGGLGGSASATSVSGTSTSSPAQGSSSSVAASSSSAAEATTAPTASSNDTASGSGDTSSTASASATNETAAHVRSAEIKPSAELAGQAELANRKGTWKYEAEADAEAEPKAKPKAAPKPKAEAKAKSAPKTKAAPKAKAAAPSKEGDAPTPDYDKDGVLEGTNEGRRPKALNAARDGGADDLKRIKGIGPKLEKLCNELGFYHFDQIASWSGDEVAWVNANLAGFKGRVSRDNWVEQAALLASGGETEFSKRVGKGGVY